MIDVVLDQGGDWDTQLKGRMGPNLIVLGGIKSFLPWCWSSRVP